MNKYLKILVTACLTVCMAVCLGLFAAACTEEKPDSFTVTVTADGKGVAGVVVQFCPVGEACLNETTDAEGKAVFELKQDGIDFTDAEEFEIHLVTVPEGYTATYIGENNLVKVAKAKDGYSATIELTKKSASVDPVSIECSFDAQNQIKEVEPAISVAGFYEIRSAEAFNYISGSVTVENVTSVFVRLEKGDKIKLGATGGNTSYSLFAIYSEKDPAASAVEATAGRAYVLKLKAGEKATFSNPAVTSDRREGSVISVNGSNARFTAYGKNYSSEFYLGTGKNVEVSTAEGTAGEAIVWFGTPSANSPVAVGAQTSFEVTLVENSDGEKVSLSWMSSYYNLAIELPQASENATYKITLTSSLADDAPEITNMLGYGDGDVTIAPDVEKNPDGSYAVTVTPKNLAVTRNFRIEVSPKENADYSGSANGDKITYTVLVEKI